MASMKPKKSSLPPPKARQAVTVGDHRRSRNGPIVIAVIVGIAVVVGIIVAVLVSGGGDDGDSAPPLSEIVKPVTVDGDPLAPLTREIINGDESDPAIGELAPIVSGFDYEDNPITIDAADNGPTMVVLLAHWCPHCNAEIPRLNEWRDSGDVPDNLNIVGVSTAVDPNAQNYSPDQWLVDRDWQWSVLADSYPRGNDPTNPMSAFGTYGGQYFPTVVIIGSDGRVLLRFSGEPSADEINELVTAALANDTAA